MVERDRWFGIEALELRENAVGFFLALHRSQTRVTNGKPSPRGAGGNSTALDANKLSVNWNPGPVDFFRWVRAHYERLE